MTAQPALRRPAPSRRCCASAGRQHLGQATLCGGTDSRDCVASKPLNGRVITGQCGARPSALLHPPVAAAWESPFAISMRHHRRRLQPDGPAPQAGRRSQELCFLGQKAAAMRRPAAAGSIRGCRARFLRGIARVRADPRCPGEAHKEHVAHRGYNDGSTDCLITGRQDDRSDDRGDAGEQVAEADAESHLRTSATLSASTHRGELALVGTEGEQLEGCGCDVDHRANEGGAWAGPFMAWPTYTTVGARTGPHSRLSPVG